MDITDKCWLVDDFGKGHYTHQYEKKDLEDVMEHWASTIFIGFKQHTSWDWTTEPWKMMINVDFSINNGGFMGL